MNSFGRLFRVTIFGESHGRCTGVTIDGVKPGLVISHNDFAIAMERRKGNKGSTTRSEADQPVFLSGILEGRTTGAPLTIIFENKNFTSEDYQQFRDIPRPGHADFVAGVKFRGFNDLAGGGHFSARLTVALVAAGVVARKMIPEIIISARVISVAGISDYHSFLTEISEKGDSAGGVVDCSVKQVRTGLGEPFFDSVESLLSHAIFAIPSVKAIEFGVGFSSSEMKGSQYNDILCDTDGKTATNNCGGINGGLSNGNDINFRVAFHPVPSISIPQETINLKTGKTETLKIYGKHDTCAVLRAPVIVEAVAAIVFADLALIAECYHE